MYGYDNYCPFCDTASRVIVYVERTSMFDRLYRCEFCYEVFDQRQQEIQEGKARELRRRKIAEKETVIFIDKAPPKKKSKKPIVFLGVVVFTSILIFMF